MARLFGTPTVRPTVGLSVWRRREEGVTGEAGPEPLWPAGSGFDGRQVHGVAGDGDRPLRPGTGRLLSPAGWAGLKLGNNGTDSGKKGALSASPRERPEPQVGQLGAGHLCPNYW
eukprot:scaffold91820_cov45-Phaeocystis_antarctica.AAC.1